MEGSESRREKLARIGVEARPREPRRGWQVALDRVADVWERFTAFSGWERAFFVGGCVLAVAVAVGAVVALTRSGGGDDARPVAVSRPRASPVPTTGPAPTATPIDVAVASLPTRSAANRENCDEIRGSEYLSDEERDWFLANCESEDDGGTTVVSRPPGSGPAQPPQGGSSPPPPPPPPPTQPPPTGGLSSSEAISLAIGWMTYDAPEAYVVDGGSCSAVQIGDHWVVTCQATIAGCQGSVCAATLSVCVFDDPRRVVPTDQC